MKDPQLYLASSSPRRRELLSQLGLTYRVLDVDVDEARQGQESPQDHIRRLAVLKARSGLRQLPADNGLPVLGADTVVLIDDEVLGKPRDREDGIRMLQRLSGRTHQVLSAVAVAGKRVEVRTNISSVSFRALQAGECAAYWDTGEPADKAGAYAIQGIAAIFVTRLEGSYSAVMGLPLAETADLLRGNGIDILSGHE